MISIDIFFQMSSDNEDVVPGPDSDSDLIPVSGRGNDWSSTEFQSLTEYNQVLDTIITVTSRSKMEIVYVEYVLINLRNEHFVEKHFVK